jgi:hypothetical protein
MKQSSPGNGQLSFSDHHGCSFLQTPAFSTTQRCEQILRVLSLLMARSRILQGYLPILDQSLLIVHILFLGPCCLLCLEERAVEEPLSLLSSRLPFVTMKAGLVMSCNFLLMS